MGNAKRDSIRAKAAGLKRGGSPSTERGTVARVGPRVVYTYPSLPMGLLPILLKMRVK